MCIFHEEVGAKRAGAARAGAAAPATPPGGPKQSGGGKVVPYTCLILSYVFTLVSPSVSNIALDIRTCVYHLWCCSTRSHTYCIICGDAAHGRMHIDRYILVARRQRQRQVQCLGRRLRLDLGSLLGRGHHGIRRRVHRRRHGGLLLGPSAARIALLVYVFMSCMPHMI